MGKGRQEYTSYFLEVTDMKRIFAKELLIIIAITQNCTQLNIGKLKVYHDNKLYKQCQRVLHVAQVCLIEPEHKSPSKLISTTINNRSLTKLKALSSCALSFKGLWHGGA